MLVDDPVKRVDNMTMAWGLEARTPFLDHELVAAGGGCPAELKLAHGGKGILKRIARGLLPDAVIDRPKGYFPVPALSHLEGEVLALVRDALTPERVERRAVFEPGYVEMLLAEPNDSPDDPRRQQALAGRAAGAMAGQARRQRTAVTRI